LSYPKGVFEMKTGHGVTQILALMFTVFGVSLVAEQGGPDAVGIVSMLSPPFKTVSVGLVGASVSGISAAFFNHGYFIQFRRLSTAAGVSNIYLYNTSGALEHELSVWPSGTTTLHITSVDVGTNGQLAFAGLATRVDGGKVAFIAKADISATNPNYIYTGSFLATQIALADDGSIWTVGAEHAETTASGTTSVAKWSNYDILRHYGSTGVLVDHFLPRWGPNTAYVLQQVDSAGNGFLSAYDHQQKHLTNYGSPLWGAQGGYATPSNIVNQSWLRAIRGGAILYDGRSGILYRYSTSTSSLASQGVNMRSGEGSQIVGFAVSNDGKLFATFKSLDLQHPRYFGLFELLIPPSGGLATWSAVPLDPTLLGRIGRQFTVLGSDGAAIVYRSAGGQMNWSSMP
jgi:hypothetical protein